MSGIERFHCIPVHILVEAFADSLSPSERSTVKVAVEESGGQFSESLLQKLIAILSRYGCRVSPTPMTLKSQLVAIAKFEFQIKPLAAISSISIGIPHSQKKFWESFSVEELYSLYTTISGTPEKVLEILEEPAYENDCEVRVFGYLQQFIGDMKRAEIRRFLRFTTGSSVLLGSKISVIFNSLSGLARRPIAHTCSSILEFPSTNLNFLDFEQSSSVYSVIMNSAGRCMPFDIFRLSSVCMLCHQYLSLIFCASVVVIKKQSILIINLLCTYHLTQGCMVN